MINSSPNVRLIEPAYPSEQLGQSVVAALTRPMSPRLSCRPVRTFILGMLSGGILPLLICASRWRDFVTAERTHLWHFSEWLRTQYPGREAETLHEAVGKLRIRKWIWIASIVLTGIAIFSTLSILNQSGSMLTPSLLFSVTVRSANSHIPTAMMPSARVAARQFTLLMIAAQLMSLWQILAHERDVRRIANRYNRVAQKFVLMRVDAPKIRLGLSPLWIAGIVASATMGAWWGVPMMLAGAAQARYINGTGRRFRLELSAATFNVLVARRPVQYVAMPGTLRGQCGRANCDAHLLAVASFCSRCGERVIAQQEFSNV